MHDNMLNNVCYFQYADGHEIGIFDIFIYTLFFTVTYPKAPRLLPHQPNLDFVSLRDTIGFVLDFDEWSLFYCQDESDAALNYGCI